MLRFTTVFAVLALALASGGHAVPTAPCVVRASINFDESLWRTGSQPSLTFTVTSGRGPLEKSLAFLYVSEEPEAFTSSPWPPQFAGAVVGSGTLQVIVDRVPERGPINPFSRERFVQGVLRDAQTGLVTSVTNEAYLDIVYDSDPVTFELDFTNEDDRVTPLVNGQDLSTPPEFGVLVSLSALQPASGPPHFGPAIFDSASTGPNRLVDPDLLVDQGNLVILQENDVQSTPGIFASPDDAANGGSLVFEFTGFDVIEKVEPVSIDLVDIDGGSPRSTRVVLTDVLGGTRTYTVPPGWTRDITFEGSPGVGTLRLTTLAPQPGFMATATATETLGYIAGEVVRLEVDLGGSGALDNLVFRREADPDASAALDTAGPGRPRRR